MPSGRMQVMVLSNPKIRPNQEFVRAELFNEEGNPINLGGAPAAPPQSPQPKFAWLGAGWVGLGGMGGPRASAYFVYAEINQANSNPGYGPMRFQTTVLWDFGVPITIRVKNTDTVSIPLSLATDGIGAVFFVRDGHPNETLPPYNSDSVVTIPAGKVMVATGITGGPSPDDPNTMIDTYLATVLQG